MGDAFHFPEHDSCPAVALVVLSISEAGVALLGLPGESTGMS